MRARNIKPGFFKNDDLAELDPLCRLLFVGLWCMADREGRLEYRPKRIKAEVLPYDTINIEDYLCSLEGKGMLAKYEVDGIEYLEIVGFHKHQNPHHMEVPSEIPHPVGAENKYNHKPITKAQRQRIFSRDKQKCQKCGSRKNLHIDHVVPVSKGGSSDDENLQTLCQACNISKGNRPQADIKSIASRGRIDDEKTTHADSLIPDSLIPDSKTFCASVDAQREDFEKFWEAFSYKKGREQSWKSWRKITNYSPKLVEMIIAAAKVEAARRPSLKAEGLTPKMAQGWITGKRWEDEKDSASVKSATYTTPKSAMDNYEPPHVAELRELREAANGK